MKKYSLVLVLIFLSGAAFAKNADLVERLEDRNNDGKLETKVYLGPEGLIEKEVSDKNADGKADKITQFKKGKPWYGEEDADFDGKTDKWNYYDEKGNLVYIVMDTNKDGIGDTVRQFVKGRNLVLREYDRNFDGKVDKRALTQWDPDKKIVVPDGNRMNKIPTPGYITLWTDEDNNYDGKIDKHYERGGDAGAPSEKLGTPIRSENPDLFKPKSRLDKRTLS